MIDKPNNLTLGELFAGVMGFSAGFELSGFRTLWAVERDKDCLAVIRRQRPEIELVNDVNNPAVFGLRTPTVITFGSPCTDLSLAGKRAGLAGEKSGLFFRALEIIGALKPWYAIWENVAGAYSSNGGDDLKTVVRQFAEIGYSVAWRTWDGQYFGPPQRRRRIFLVATLDPCGRAGAERCAEILSLSEGLCRDLVPCRSPWSELAGGAGGSVAGGGWRVSRGWAGDRGSLPAITQAALTRSLGDGGADDNRAQAGFYIPIAPSVDATLGANKQGGFSIDLDRMTFIPCVAHTLTSGGHSDGVARDGRRHEDDYNIVASPLTTDPYADNAAEEGKLVIVPPALAFVERGRDGERSVECQEDLAYCLRTHGGGSSLQNVVEPPVSCPEEPCGVTEVIPFHPQQVTRPGSSVTHPGDPALALTSSRGGGAAPAIAYTEVAACKTGSNERQDASVETFIVHSENSSAMTGDGDAAVAFPTDVSRCLDQTGGYTQGQGGVVALVDAPMVANTLTASLGHHGHSSPRGDGGDKIVAAVARAKRRVRRLTPRECERLQGLPDDWTRWGVDESGREYEISDSSRYSMTGNMVMVAVTAVLGDKVASTILEALAK